MVRLRLQRHGRKKLPFYHIVAADVRVKRDGRIIEDLGRFSPTQEPSLLRLETDRVIYWLKNGAQPSDTVRSILKKEGILYRLHLERWGRSEEEIDATISAWKEERGAKKKAPATKAEKMKAQLKAEEAQFKKEQEENAKAAAEKAQLKADEAKAAVAKQEEEEAAAAKAEAEVKPEAEAGKEEAKADAAEKTEEKPKEEAKADEEVKKEVEATKKEEKEEPAEDASGKESKEEKK